MKELGPAVKSVYLVPCGHVFADVAMKEIQEKICPECGAEFEQDNIVPLLATSEADIERLEKRIENLKSQGLTHTSKKDKSEKKKKHKGDDMEKEDKAANGAKEKKTEDARISGINNSFAASLTAKVLAEQDERNKRRKLVAESARRETARG
ncbi:Replication termination factor 2 [Fusarium oxysporum]|uniref:Uncharacterized protein n=1 Tax=Fusarium oxysporum f. sp. melonis 26406 TaxID=1089452 RepID=W9ZU78_FUSOX|nr:hypothetical protein FOMG_18645 [Fusarium oxysporum f. sp. melonis 26406]KAJ4013679.1 Replication termination factor 2 [Fusarium oxysporum]KAJ4069056.1 Replication termination factor 2 [Fusarium oxysporum]KAJ4131272.1 Replication termination factor 2 [Fusarium oxysporum]KAJ4252986.1 Replication termination factor 2 [Fusarium oxysporum]